jgi:hypothetical protein
MLIIRMVFVSSWGISGGTFLRRPGYFPDERILQRQWAKLTCAILGSEMVVAPLNAVALGKLTL